jgi:hypothetical protein
MLIARNHDCKRSPNKKYATPAPICTKIQAILKSGDFASLSCHLFSLEKLVESGERQKSCFIGTQWAQQHHR